MAMGWRRGRIDFARRHFECLVDTQLSAASALIAACDTTCQRRHRNWPKGEERDELLSLLEEQKKR